MKNTNYSVKKRHSYLFLLLALLVSSTMNAKVNHYVGAWANIGEWSLMTQNSTYGVSYGVSGGIGGVYELQAGPTYSRTRFLADVGVGVNIGTTGFQQRNNQNITLANQLDLQGDLFDYVYEVSGRQDSYRNILLQVPLMIGVQHKRFYMLAGAKIGYSLYTTTFSTAMVNTYGLYSSFVDPMRNMPEYQFFTDIKKEGGVRTSFNLDVDACLEIGCRIGLVTGDVGYDVPKRKIEYRIAAYADYGLLDLHSKRTQLPLITPTVYDTNPTSPNYVYNSKSMVDNLQLNDIMSTDNFASSVTNLMVGVKFTILFQLPEEGQCLLCRDAYLRMYKSGRGGTGVKYEK